MNDGEGNGLGSFIGAGDDSGTFPGVTTTGISTTSAKPMVGNVIPQDKALIGESRLEDNPEEEYFRLLVLSVKILHSEKDPEFGVEVSTL